MWKYLVGFSVDEARQKLGGNVSSEEIISMLKKHGFSYTYDTPASVIADIIPSLLGKEYKNPSTMQKDAPNAFSCSSLVSYLATIAGLPWMPSITADKYIYLPEVSASDLQYGDLLFSNSGEGKIHFASIEWRHGTIIPEGVDHVGMYLGDSMVLHASRTTGCVKIESLTEAVSFRNIVGYRRIADLTEPRFCITIPDEFPELRSKDALLNHLAHGEHADYIKSILPVDYLSQLYNINDPYWTNRACGGVCLAMAAKYFGKNIPTDLSAYFYESEQKGYFTKTSGWLHQGLIEMAKALGLDAYRSEGGMVDDLALEIKAGNLVILSVSKSLFGVKRAHLVLCVGVAITALGDVVGAYIYDPELLYPPEKPRFVSAPLLISDWSGKYVVVQKSV